MNSIHCRRHSRSTIINLIIIISRGSLGPDLLLSAATLQLFIINLLFFITAASSLTLNHAHYKSRFADVSADHNVFLTTTHDWINQTLDHFAPEGSATFRQRYYEFLDYFNAPDGPIFLTISGESTCYGIANDYVAVLAKRFGAAVVTLEHRYYGYSSPFSEFDTQNLQYLSSKQALFDLAVFRNVYQERINRKYYRKDHEHHHENAWITFGGSYAGALSAWFRLKFPHLTHGSLASSAVVHVIEDYYQYDQQVAKSVGPTCTKALQAVTKIAIKYLKSNSTYIKSLFDAEMIEDVDLLNLLADAMSLSVQYGFYDILCDPLVKSFEAGEDVLLAYNTFVKTMIYGKFGVAPQDYSKDHLKGLTKANPSSGLFLWTYQVCTEFGFFQTAPRFNSVRSSKLDKKYFLEICKYVYNEEAFPRSSLTNLYYGGTRIEGSRIIFTNGVIDPWQHASKLVSALGVSSIMIRCENCAHCVDLEGCPQFPFHPLGNASLCTPSSSILEARKLIIENLEEWLLHQG